MCFSWILSVLLHVKLEEVFHHFTKVGARHSIDLCKVGPGDDKLASILLGPQGESSHGWSGSWVKNRERPPSPKKCRKNADRRALPGMSSNSIRWNTMQLDMPA